MPPRDLEAQHRNAQRVAPLRVALGSYRGVQGHDPARHPRNTHETPTRARNHHLKTLTTSERARTIGQRSHCANFSSRWLPGRRTDGRRRRRRTTNKFARRAPATEESSRARSFARSHARTQRKRKRNRNRFPGSGVGLKPIPHPQPPINLQMQNKNMSWSCLAG